MALLDPVHWNTVTPQMRDLMRFIGQQTFAGRFYLAGGTALALRLGHRRSGAFDNSLSLRPRLSARFGSGIGESEELMRAGVL